MRNLILITVIGLKMHIVASFHKDNSISENKTLESVNEIVNAYSSVFQHQDAGCMCQQNYCRCCEDAIGDVCISVGYYEVFDLPAAFGVNVTNNKEQKPLVSVTFNVTDLPCINLPYIKNPSVCLKLYGFDKTSEYVKVLFDLVVKFPFTSFKVYLGCLLIPRLHPHPDTNKTVHYGSLMKQMGLHKNPYDLGGITFCNSANPAIIYFPMYLYSSLLLVLLLNMFIR